MNIVLVVFDTLRKDCLGAYGTPPWGPVRTPHLDAFAREALVMDRAYPNVLPTLPARIALYTGRQVYPFEQGDVNLKGDFGGAPGWGPIPEDWPTLAEVLGGAGYRTALVADLFHMFKPSKNFWRGFDQWTFLRGQETDSARSGPRLRPEDLARWLPDEVRQSVDFMGPVEDFIQQCLLNMHDRRGEEEYFAPQVFREAARWLEQNQDAEHFFLTVESFDPHEPWLVPPHYRRMYQPDGGPEHVIATYADISRLDPRYLRRARANYSGLVTMCDRWFGYLFETLRVLGRLDDTLVIVTADHGHTLGEGDYLGKRGYPSRPEVYDVPLLVRFPGGQHAGRRSGLWVQHVDLAATLLAEAGAPTASAADGRPFLQAALGADDWGRDHVTVGWGSTPTVITDRWWLNCKADGRGVLLYDRSQADPFARSVGDEQPEVVQRLFAQAVADAGGALPEWLVELARAEADAPGCSMLAARP